MDGRNYFYKWDLNQKLLVKDATISEVHFSNRMKDSAMVVAVSAQYTVDVPNILLQEGWDINVYAVSADYTKYSQTIKVRHREKPQDYIYEETEIKRWEDLERRIEELENGEGGAGAVSSVNGKVGDVVLTANDVGAAEPSYVRDSWNSLKVFIDANTTAIEELSTNFDNYYTKEETENAIKRAFNSLIDGDEVSY